MLFTKLNTLIMRSFLFFLILLEVGSFVHGQSLNHDFPPIKPFMKKELYLNLKKYYKIAVKNIRDSSNFWFNSSSDYWNIFMVHASLSNDSLSRFYWKKIMTKYPFEACDLYKFFSTNQRTAKVNPNCYYNLIKNSKFYDSCCQNYYNSLDSSLIRELVQIEKDDQHYRLLMDEATLSSQKKEYWNKQIELDSQNLIKIDSIFKKYGYPGRDLVGNDNEKTMFLVIQHSDIETMEKYLPYIKNEIQEHTLDPQVYAYLKDRINMIKGEPQIFGTQVQETKDEKFELYEMRSMYKIDSLRASFNLGSLSNYLKQYGIIIEE